jgi:hypothetical protein
LLIEIKILHIVVSIDFQRRKSMSTISDTSAVFLSPVVLPKKSPKRIHNGRNLGPHEVRDFVA